MVVVGKFVGRGTDRRIVGGVNGVVGCTGTTTGAGGATGCSGITTGCTGASPGQPAAALAP